METTHRHFYHPFLYSLLLPLFLACCAPTPQTAPPVSKVSTFASKKRILIFFDGTNNEWSSRTNTRRLFENLASREDPSLVCHYVEGVGTGIIGSVSGSILGQGMKSRILDGYKFLSHHYKPGNDIYVFGFSRGAHQARALTGIISHCGLLDSESATPRNLNRVWHLCRKKDDLSLIHI